jgi:hypothetical protein
MDSGPSGVPSSVPVLTTSAWPSGVVKKPILLAPTRAAITAASS